MNSEPAILYKSPWVVPIVSPVIRDGGVLVRGARIERVGKFSELCKMADRVVEVDGALMPRLINCHAHLELSVYGERFREILHIALPENFPGWIRALLALRGEAVETGEIVSAGRKLAARMADEGVAVVLDTGNLTKSSAIGEGVEIEDIFLLEMLGLTEAAAKERCNQLRSLGPEVKVTAHAPYSTHPVLLRGVKERCRKFGHLFSIHTAESLEETELLATGSGPFVEFLQERGVWDGSFVTPGLSPVAYLDSLHLLDEKTLCVHCVQVDEKDLAILAKRKAKVCLCPESNRTLGVGVAPVEEMLLAGLAPCLGTDSLTSNPHCSLWREMQILREDHPGFTPSDILAAATINSAKVLGLEERMGAIAPGCEATMLAIEHDCRSEEVLLEHLVSVGNEVRLKRIGESYG